MTETEMKQLCLDLSEQAIALFDMVEAGGIDAPMNSMDGAVALGEMVAKVEEMRSYYLQRSFNRLVDLGISPQTLLSMTPKKAEHGSR